MVKIVTPENKNIYALQLHQMFEQRHSVFVKQLKWDLPLSINGLESDQFDTDDTIYLLSLDEQGNVQGSCRLNPTLKPHLLSEKFTHLVEENIPRGPDIWESSRSCIPLENRNKGIIGELFLATVETSLILGIQQITFICNMDFYLTILHAGWGHIPLGSPQSNTEGGYDIAGTLIINPVALRNMRRKFQVFQPVISDVPANIAA